MCGAYCCAGEVLVPAGLQAHCDASGYQLCELCPSRLNRSGPHRPYGGGRAHQSCIKALSRAAAAPVTPVPRAKRPYIALMPTQKWKRPCKARVAVAEMLSEISGSPQLSCRIRTHALRVCCAFCSSMLSLLPHTPSSPSSSMARLHSSLLQLLQAMLGFLQCPIQHSRAQSSALLVRTQNKTSTTLSDAAPQCQLHPSLLGCSPAFRDGHCRLRRFSLHSFTLRRCTASPSLLSACSAAVLSSLCLVVCAQRSWQRLPLACSLCYRHKNTHASLPFVQQK